MTTQLYIDGIDALEEWGVAPAEGAYADLVTFPRAKTPYQNDWAEDDGVEVDDGAPVLEPRTVKVKFYIADIDDVARFVADITDGAVHSFSFAELDKTFYFRYSAENTSKVTVTFGIVELTFEEDAPARPRVLSPASSPLTYSVECFIDSIDVARFAMLVTEGSLANVIEVAGSKKALSVTSTGEDGRRYDEGATVRFSQRNVKINLHCFVDSVEVFWKRYEAFYHLLTSSSVHKFEMAGVQFNFIYKESDSERLIITGEGKVWYDFSVKLATVNNR